MKFRITLKDPDGVSDGVKSWANQILETAKLSAKVNKAAQEAQIEELDEFISTWVDFGEYVVIEFDTEAGTARLLPLTEVD